MIDGLVDPLQLLFLIAIVGIVVVAARWLVPPTDAAAVSADADTLSQREQKG